MAYVTETLKSHLADFTSVSQLVSQNEKVHTRWGCTPQTYTTERKMRDGEDIVALLSALLSVEPLVDLAQMARMPL